MRTTIDKAGRVIIPAVLRDQIGLEPGPVDVVVDGAAVRIEYAAPDNLVQRGGRLVIAADEPSLTDEQLRDLRLADQR